MEDDQTKMRAMMEVMEMRSTGMIEAAKMMETAKAAFPNEVLFIEIKMRFVKMLSIDFVSSR